MAHTNEEMEKNAEFRIIVQQFKYLFGEMPFSRDISN